MTQPHCASCGSPLTPEDAFCGGCGTAVGRNSPVQVATSTSAAWASVPVQATSASVAASQDAGETAWWQPRREPERAEAGAEDFFGHAAARPAGPLSNATRYLCAAAYLDPAYANAVISELTASHRAVAPSLGIDLIPVIRHCLSARRSQLLRDVLLTVVLICGIFLAPVPVIAILVISACLSVLPGVQWERRSFGIKLVAGIGIALAVGAILVYYLLTSLFSSVNGNAVPHFGLLASGVAVVFVVLAFLVLAGLILVGYSYSMYRTFSDRLRPGASPGRFERSSPEVEERIAQVAAAQQGNMTIYGGENPFIGTGARQRGEDWSIAIELDRAKGPGADSGRPARKSYVPIDPVELHQVIRARLLKVKDEQLPENERISALTVHDAVVGDGHCRWDSPVLDQARAISYSQASQEAIEALIRHPAAGLRYHLRVCVSDEGQPVWARRREVLGPTDQEVALSAFVYVAVEGRMLYLEFVPTILPPVRQEYHLVDRLPKVTSSEFMVKVVLHAVRSSFRDIVRAPFGIFGTTSRMVSDWWSYRSEIKSASDYVFADIGARISVREIGGAAFPRTYIQILDMFKYTKIIQRLVLDTVLDFLREKGVDTSVYSRAANAIISNSFTNLGTVGSWATGTHGKAEGNVNVTAGGADSK